MLVSYVAGEGVELTVHKESVVVEKIKEVELRSRRAQLFMTEIIIELGHSHAPNRLPVKRLRRLLHRRRKVRVFVWKGICKNIISYCSSAFTIIHNHDAEVFAPIASCSVQIHPNMSLLFCMQVL